MKRRVIELVDSKADRLIEISHKIHGFAELGYEEYRSSALLVEEHRKYGFDVEKPVAGLETAFRAIYRGKPGGPNIGLLGEYDALPDMAPGGRPGHACGHNLIGTATLGAGYALSNIIGECDLAGTVSVFGCPCEEGYKEGAGGKIPMLKAGVFEGIDVSMMVHAGFGKYGVWGKARARENLVTSFTGRRATSNEARYDVVNALDAAVLMLNGLYVLKQRLRPNAVLTYIISEGGVNPNIVPLTAQVRTYCRSLDYDYLTELVEKVKETARGAAKMVGAKVEFKRHAPTYAASIPNMTLVRRYHENLLQLGVEVEEPSESARKILRGERAYSTDYGWVSREIPSGTIFISLGPPGTSLHTKAAVEATRSRGADEAMLTGAKAMAMTGVDFLMKPELVEAAKEELEGYKASKYQHPYPT